MDARSYQRYPPSSLGRTDGTSDRRGSVVVGRRMGIDGLGSLIPLYSPESPTPFLRSGRGRSCQGLFFMAPTPLRSLSKRPFLSFETGPDDFRGSLPEVPTGTKVVSAPDPFTSRHVSGKEVPKSAEWRYTRSQTYTSVTRDLKGLCLENYLRVGSFPRRGLQLRDQLKIIKETRGSRRNTLFDGTDRRERHGYG